MAKSKWPQVKEAVDDGRIENWLAKGLLEKTVAANLGVHVGTWEKYKSEHPELRDAIKRGNRVIVKEVEDALVRRALGYDYEESTMHSETITDDDGVTKTKKTVDVRKRHMAPDTGACIFILKNKDKEHWKSDPALSDLREMELQLRREIAEGEGKLWGSGETSTEATHG